MNHKTERIIKLLLKGLTPEQISKTLGYQDMEAAKVRIEQARILLQKEGQRD